MVTNNSSNTYGTAQFIVSPTAGFGNYTTIAAALSAASSGSTIFLCPGTYTENPTLKAGVNLTAYDCDSLTPNVVINGTCTLTGAGTVSISGIQLETNSAALLAITGSAASIVNLNNCYLNCSNNTGITFSSSSSSAALNVNYCSGNLGTTGIALYSHSSAGVIAINYSQISNSGSSTTASSNSSGSVVCNYSTIKSPLSTSSTGALSLEYTIINQPGNTTCVTTAGTGTFASFNSYYTAGSASCVSVGAGTTFTSFQDIYYSTNTNAITGSGTIEYQSPILISSTGINTTTQTNSGLLRGSVNTAPSLGFVGERISSVANASLTNNTPANLTSIALTAGVWDISAQANFIFTGVDTYAQLGISTTTATISGTQGDQWMQYYIGASASGSNLPMNVVNFRAVISSTTTYYCVVNADFTTGACTAYGRISATRVG